MHHLNALFSLPLLKDGLTIGLCHTSPCLHYWRLFFSNHFYPSGNRSWNFLPGWADVGNPALWVSYHDWFLFSRVMTECQGMSLCVTTDDTVSDKVSGGKPANAPGVVSFSGLFLLLSLCASSHKLQFSPPFFCLNITHIQPYAGFDRSNSWIVLKRRVLGTARKSSDIHTIKLFEEESKWHQWPSNQRALISARLTSIE